MYNKASNPNYGFLPPPKLGEGRNRSIGSLIKIYIYYHQNSNVFTGREKGHMKRFSKRFLTFLKCKDAWGIKNKSDKNIGQFPTSLGSPAMMQFFRYMPPHPPTTRLGQGWTYLRMPRKTLRMSHRFFKSRRTPSQHTANAQQQLYPPEQPDCALWTFFSVLWRFFSCYFQPHHALQDHVFKMHGPLWRPAPWSFIRMPKAH